MVVYGYFIFLFLVAFVCLVIGLIKPSVFNRVFRREMNRKKTSLIFGVAFVVFFIIAGVTTPPSAPVAPTASTAQTNTLVKNKTAPTPLSEQDQIKQIISNELKGNNNRSEPYLRNTNVSQQADGTWNVAVEYNADDNLTKNMIKEGMETTMSKIYEDLYRNNSHNIGLATVSAFFPMTDKYGNTQDDIVYTSQLASDEAQKVNWSEDSAWLELKILPGVWDTIFLSPSFQ